MPQPNQIPIVREDVIWKENQRQVINRIGNQVGGYATQVVVAGFSLQIPNSTGTLILLPAGTLASGTVTLAVNAPDGFVQRIMSTQVITALTLSAPTGTTIVGATTTLAANSEAVYFFVAASSVWYKLR